MPAEMGKNASQQCRLDFKILGNGFNNPIALGKLGQVVVEVAGSNEMGKRRFKKSGRFGLGESGDCGFREALRAFTFGGRSSKSTGIPALARCAAIREPMVPAPRTAARRTNSGFASSRGAGVVVMVAVLMGDSQYSILLGEAIHAAKLAHASSPSNCVARSLR